MINARRSVERLLLLGSRMASGDLVHSVQASLDQALYTGDASCRAYHRACHAICGELRSGHAFRSLVSHLAGFDCLGSMSVGFRRLQRCRRSMVQKACDLRFFCQGAKIAQTWTEIQALRLIPSAELKTWLKLGASVSSVLHNDYQRFT